ncbi:hypothetical protein DdX_18077 [Ditylenchus destructor]|uniref:Helitron helicase-like domain-containing protein n=1 Tax=Ditylenchus destructor TaxID=166010 RepID=A0AAD4MLE3_9BILA|nr:hypothetical protein DdX_18077 [Ditylenchus destructor]
MNAKNQTNEMSNLLARERDPTKDYTFKLGSFDFPCVHCGALHFKNEANQNELKKNKAERSYDDCCSHGKIIYEDSPPFPNVLKSLFLKQHPRANEFIENIRNINASFGFVSINAHVKNLRGQYHYRIQGPLYHLFNHKAHPIPGTLPSYGQLFFLDTNQASDIRANNPLNAREEFRRSMIMAKRFGPPDLFITITFGSDNEDLKKAINIELEDGQSIQQQSNFRPDMVARAFELIYADFIELIWKNNDNGEPTFGKIQCYSAKAYADIANLFITERGEPITSIYGMPEPDMTLNDIAMNIDNVQHKEIAETMLTQNQRVDPDEIEFLETLKQLGDGELQDGDEGYFEFPEECLSNDLITDVYGSALATKNYDEMHERVLLTPLNKDANEICKQVLEFLEGNAFFYQTSARQVQPITRVRLWGSFERLILGSSLHQGEGRARSARPQDWLATCGGSQTQTQS